LVSKEDYDAQIKEKEFELDRIKREIDLLKLLKKQQVAFQASQKELASIRSEVKTKGEKRKRQASPTKAAITKPKLDSRSVRYKSKNKDYIKSRYVGVIGWRSHKTGKVLWYGRRIANGKVVKNIRCDSELEAAFQSDEIARENGLTNLNFPDAPTTGVKQE